MELPPIVSEQEWQEARDALLEKEKELTHARGAMAAERRRMPRMLVEEYEFEGPHDTITDDLKDFGVGELARHQRLPAGRGSDLPRLLRRRARRRGPRRHVQLPRHHAARAPGGLGGFARGLPAGPAWRLLVVATPRRVRARPARAAARRRDPDRRRRARAQRNREPDMTPLAHVAGVPIEELALTAAGAGTALLVARTWVSLRLRGRRGGPA